MTSSDFRTVAFIFARGGSKGLPGKNVKILDGTSLIGHAIRLAKASSLIETVIVSTDDEEIASEARKCGAEVPFMRPANLATDNAPEWKAWQHAVQWYKDHRGEFDAFLSLPPTSPFRALEDIEACIELLREDENADIIITVREAERSPYFNMVSLTESGYAQVVMPPDKGIHRRQDAPTVYDITTVAYAAKPSFVLCSDRLFSGRVKSVLVPAERALDIDTPYDFELAKAIALIRRQRLE